MSESTLDTIKYVVMIRDELYSVELNLAWKFHLHDRWGDCFILAARAGPTGEQSHGLFRVFFTEEAHAFNEWPDLLLSAARSLAQMMSAGEKTRLVMSDQVQDALSGASIAGPELRQHVLDYLGLRAAEAPRLDVSLIELLAITQAAPQKILAVLKGHQERGNLMVGKLEDIPPDSIAALSDMSIEDTRKALLSSVYLSHDRAGSIVREAERRRLEAIAKETEARDVAGPVRIFLSHSHNDLDLVKSIKNGLEKHGVSVFVAHTDIDIDDDWRYRILEELNNCHVFAALITDSFRKSDWTDQEAGIAIGKDKMVCPIIASREPYGLLGMRQGVRLNQDAIVETCDRIIGRIKAHSTLGKLLERP